jgi:hypothetical protein
MKEETRKLRFYLRSGKPVPPRKVYCYAIESVSRYEPQDDVPILRKRTTHTVWRAATPNERASFNSMKECRAWIARITGRDYAPPTRRAPHREREAKAQVLLRHMPHT